MAEAGSGVPDTFRCAPVGYDRAEKPEDDADVGLLFLPSTIVKLSDLERPLPSLAPLAGCGCDGGRSCSVLLLPIGVARRSWGGAGRDEGLWREASGGRSGIALVFDTGF